MKQDLNFFHTNLYGERDYFIVSALAYAQYNCIGVLSNDGSLIRKGPYFEGWNRSLETVVRALDGEILVICHKDYPLFDSKDEFKDALRLLIRDISNNVSDNEDLFIQPASMVYDKNFSSIEEAKKDLLLKQLSVNDIDAITFYEKTSYDEMFNFKITLHDIDNAYARLSSPNTTELDPFRVEQRKYLLKETLDFMDYLHETSWEHMANDMTDYLNHGIDNLHYKGYTIFDGIVDIMVKHFDNLKNAELEILGFIEDHKRHYEDKAFLTYDWYLGFFKSDIWKNFIPLAKMLNEEDRFPSYMNILYNAHIYRYILS